MAGRRLWLFRCYCVVLLLLLVLLQGVVVMVVFVLRSYLSATLQRGEARRVGVPCLSMCVGGG